MYLIIDLFLNKQRIIQIQQTYNFLPKREQT